MCAAVRASPTSGELLPDVTGRGATGLPRVAATLRRLLEESGDPVQLNQIDWTPGSLDGCRSRYRR